jgi:hypothetical protein
MITKTLLFFINYHTLAGYLVGGAAVWFFKGHIRTGAVWLWQHVTPWIKREVAKVDPPRPPDLEDITFATTSQSTIIYYYAYQPR